MTDNNLHFIDAALVIGILVQCTKLGDLLISEEQKKEIQRKFEFYTLKLEYSRPLEWFALVFEPKILNKILLIVGGMGLTIICVSQFSELDSGHTSLSDWKILVFTTLTAAVLLFGTTWVGFRYYGLRIIEWTAYDKKWATFIGRYLVVVFGFAGVITPFNLVLVIFPDVNPIPFIIFYSALVLSGAIGVWWTITVAGYIIILYQVALLFTKYVTGILRWILWRVVEFNKGAVAALTLLVTVIIGVFSVVARI